jgi:hypothetical protein
MATTSVADSVEHTGRVVRRVFHRRAVDRAHRISGPPVRRSRRSPGRRPSGRIRTGVAASTTNASGRPQLSAAGLVGCNGRDDTIADPSLATDGTPLGLVGDGIEDRVWVASAQLSKMIRRGASTGCGRWHRSYRHEVEWAPPLCCGRRPAGDRRTRGRADRLPLQDGLFVGLSRPCRPRWRREPRRAPRASSAAAARGYVVAIPASA